MVEFQPASLGPALRIVVLIFLLAFALILLAVVVILAALPGRIAKSRNHPQADAINICGWIGLPTGILWALALVWAFVRTHSTAVSPASPAAMPQPLDEQVTALEKAVAFIAN